MKNSQFVSLIKKKKMLNRLKEKILNSNCSTRSFSSKLNSRILNSNCSTRSFSSKLNSRILNLNCSAQVWIEAVIYTLIGLVIIGILLSFVKPAIEEKKDQILIEQSENMLRSIDDQIEEINIYGPGNSRIIELSIKKGKFSVNPEEESIEFLMESKYMYSEPGKEVESGKIKVKTTEKNKMYEISLRIDYKDMLNLTWGLKEENKVLQPSATPYKISIKNNGKKDSLINIDFS